tara:strand:- start:4958 stop:5734 length:777 start_codon:yes stop_codon:yes gene_type:complete
MENKITSDQIETWVESSMHYGMTPGQVKNFVINSNVTDFKQLRQVLVEIESRNHERKKIKMDMRRKEIAIERLQAKLEVETDPYERELIQIDIDEYELDLGKFSVSIRQYDYELAPFMEYIQRNFDTIEELEKAAEYKEEDERKYWIARMGKQAAIDIYANGRIGIGNMDSIAMMREEDQIYAVNIAMQYAGLLNAGVAKIQNELKPQIDKLLADGSSPRFPTFDRIEDNLNLDLFNKLIGNSNEKKSLQSTDQPETE